MLTDGRTDGRKVITIAHPGQSSGELKIDFQDGDHGGHLGFPIGTILATFDLQVTPMLLTMFRINWRFGLEEAKKRFYGGHLGFRIGKMLAIFYLHVRPMLPSKF